jgi:hypothetical protein
LDLLREAVLTAGGIEQATMLMWTPRLVKLRSPRGTPPDAQAAMRERNAHRELFETADVFMWLPHNAWIRGTYNGGESEWILGRWRGRGLHMHWYPDVGSQPGDAINTLLYQIYERAILELDYEAQRDLQSRLIQAIRGRRLRVTAPAGTDISFRLAADGWYHRNDGDGSREKVANAACARDREEEVPCGSVRTIPEQNTVEGIISLRGIPWNGFPIDIEPFVSHLDLVFRGGRLVEVDAGERQADWEAAWAKLSGDRDRLGEIVFGTNPLLETPPGARLPTHWNLQAGGFRMHLGDNVESGGDVRTNLWINLFFTDATISADGDMIVKGGVLQVS